LKNHRSNIEKSLALGDWQKIKKEELNALRVIKQIKNLLLEMDSLREKVREEDLERFDDLMRPGRENAFAGMKEFAGKFGLSPQNTIYINIFTHFRTATQVAHLHFGFPVRRRPGQSTTPGSGHEQSTCPPAHAATAA